MRKKDRNEDAHDFSGLPAPKVVTAADVQAKEFGVSRFGGYKMRDVDEFLDEITASMTKLAEENERLRSGAPVPVPPIGAPDPDDAARRADEIIERARAEAARIVQGAEDRAAAAGAGAMSPGDRPAITAFLAREREFLQSLATLVQGHAESIKAMAKASRSAPETGPAPVVPVTPARDPVEAPRPAPSAAGAPPSPAAEGDGGPSSEPEAPAPEAEPIRVDEPAAAAVARGEGDDAEPKQAEGDRSLRELFWGEE
ncbi:MAG: DivIVA domain-containing protein [Actinomycetota bacterium]